MFEYLFPKLRASRRSRFEELSLRDHQVYPEGGALDGAFLIRPQRSDLVLTPATPVASMGSCFAREIKNELVEQDYCYVQTEDNRWSVHASCAWERVYATVNASQILDYTSTQELATWRVHADGGLHLDLLRNRVAYPDRETAEADVRAHMDASRRAIQSSELLILTVGQNEVWRSEEHGFWFASRPPESLVSSGEATLHQLSVEENLENLERFLDRLLEVNPRVRLLVTLSPIPSLATFFDDNVVVRSSLNKSILRVALDLFLKRHPEVHYFPSYELVQTWRGNAFTEDNRHVRRGVVKAIMAAFFEAYAARPR